MRTGRMALPLALLLALASPGQARSSPPLTGSWATSLLDLGKSGSAPAEDMQDATIRQVVRVSLGGSKLRIRFSNLFGKTPLVIDAASVALSGDNNTARIVPGTLRALTFGKRSTITIAPGTEAWSDLVALPLRNGSDVAISLHVPAASDVRAVTAAHAPTAGSSTVIRRAPMI
jgi:hypothetical protein